MTYDFRLNRRCLVKPAARQSFLRLKSPQKSGINHFQHLSAKLPIIMKSPAHRAGLYFVCSSGGGDVVGRAEGRVCSAWVRACIGFGGPTSARRDVVVPRLSGWEKEKSSSNFLLLPVGADQRSPSMLPPIRGSLYPLFPFVIVILFTVDL